MKKKQSKHIFCKLKVKRSPISGLGLIAEENIKKETKIIEYIGEILNEKKVEQVNSKYLFEISKNKTLDGSPRYNTARYANHSCRPNAYSEIKNGRIYLFSQKKIKIGEEITFNYGKEYKEEYLNPCRCNHCLKNN